MLDEMILLTRTPQRDLPSQFTKSLIGRRINLSPINEEKIHLYTALAQGWRKVSVPATDLVSELRKLQKSSSARAEFKPAPLMRELKSLIYAATEVFDIYYQFIPKQLVVDRTKADLNGIREYQRVVKKLRDAVGDMCNLMKHEHRDLVPGRITSEVSGEVTFVFRVNTASGQMQDADARVHKGGSFISIERIVHEILHRLLKADSKAGTLVDHLSDHGDQHNTLKGITGFGLTAVLDELLIRPPVVAASEPARIDGIEADNDIIRLTKVTAVRVPEPTIRTMLVTVDEVARSIQLML